MICISRKKNEVRVFYCIRKIQQIEVDENSAFKPIVFKKFLCCFYNALKKRSFYI
jgi:hypothetical protein